MAFSFRTRTVRLGDWQFGKVANAKEGTPSPAEDGVRSYTKWKGGVLHYHIATLLHFYYVIAVLGVDFSRKTATATLTCQNTSYRETTSDTEPVLFRCENEDLGNPALTWAVVVSTKL